MTKTTALRGQYMTCCGKCQRRFANFAATGAHLGTPLPTLHPGCQRALTSLDPARTSAGDRAMKVKLARARLRLAFGR